ncbi:MAG: AEC family transporter [Rhodospirillaceae bacterium]|nr:AEC family transporter [Rhodospirillaceae bacterium]
MKFGWFPQSAAEGVARFVFDFAIPALLFRAMANANVFSNPPWELWLAFFPAALAIYGIGMVIALSVFKRDFEGAAITGMGACYGNTVLLGIPINLLVLGDAGALPSFLIISIHSLILMTSATVLLESGRADGRGPLATAMEVLKGMGTNPVVLGLGAGLAWNASGLSIPSMADQVLTFMKGAVIPCSLFALGATLARYGIKGRIAQSIVVSILKLIVMPAFVWVLAAHVLHLDPVWTIAVVLMAAQPAGINMFLFANRYGTAEAIASTTIFVTTLASMVVLPVLIYLLSSAGTSL